MVNIEINGIPIKAEDGAMVIEAADAAGVTIPRFCYHKKLSISANCRMCLVEVEKVGKPLPACATPVTDGMKIFTRSPKAISAQKGVMEFLLINHPLDCPICDQGGECELQEVAVGFGSGVSTYTEGKRVVPDKDLGPLISTDMTRCIHCTRCVRFGQEVAGIMELGATGRGEHMRIGTYVEKTVDSELSGNVIDLCPVGALTSKPFRFTARPWELTKFDSVSPHDCVGSNLHLDVLNNKVMRALPRENEAVNETWIADRDRYSYLGLDHEERLTSPMIKQDGQWHEVDWDTALTHAATKLRDIAQKDGGGQIGAVGSYTSTTEEHYLLQRVMRGIGSDNVDHRLRQQDFRGQESAALYPNLGQSIVDLENLDAALLIGSNIQKEQPLIGNRLRKAGLKGGKLMFVNPKDYAFRMPVAEQLVTEPASMATALAGIAKALLDITGEKAPEGLTDLASSVSDVQQAIAKQLHEAGNASVLIGNQVAHHPAQTELQSLAALIARLSGARFGSLAEGGNSAGAWLAGAVPHRSAAGEVVASTGMDWKAQLDAKLKAYIVMGVEPERDSLSGADTLSSLQAADTVIAMTAYVTDNMRDYADVLLPIALFPETSGTYVNIEGRWQSFSGCVKPMGDARPAWKILRVMGNLLNIDGFDYMSSEEVRDELKAVCEGKPVSNDYPWTRPDVSAGKGATLSELEAFPIYAVDPMVRRSMALQQTADGAAAAMANQ